MIAELMPVVEDHGPLIVFFAVMLQCVGLPVPAEATLLAASVVYGHGDFAHAASIAAAAAAGSIVGSELGYGLGAGLARFAPARRCVVGARLERCVDIGEGVFDRYGAHVVFVGKFFAVLRMLSGFVAGLSRQPIGRFRFANVAGGVVWATSVVLLGNGFRERIQSLDGESRLLAVAILSLLLLVLGRIAGHRLSVALPVQQAAVGRVRAGWDGSRIEVKHRVRAAVHGRLLRRTAAALTAEPLRTLFARNPALVEKPLRSYLVAGLGAEDRAAALLAHYEQAARLFRPEALFASHGAGVGLLTRDTEHGRVTIELADQGGLYREGEWRLVLKRDGRALHEMGLALSRSRFFDEGPDRPCLWIGVLKSSVRGEEGLATARELTHDFEGLRPKSLLLAAARGLAGALRLSAIYAAGNAGHVFAGYFGLGRRVRADYDTFWLESNGRRIDARVFELPLDRTVRDEQSYKAKKRAQIRRRHALEAQLDAGIAANLKTMVRD